MAFNLRNPIEQQRVTTFQIDNCSCSKGPIQVPGKDRFLRQRCGAQFVSVRAARFLAAKAVTGLEPGSPPSPRLIQSSTQKSPCTKT